MIEWLTEKRLKDVALSVLMVLGVLGIFEPDFIAELQQEIPVAIAAVFAAIYAVADLFDRSE